MLTEIEIIEWIEQHISTPRRFIGTNYTRNNFKKIKENFPIMWQQLDGRVIHHNNKKYIFCSREHKTFNINGVVFSPLRSLRSWNNKSADIL